MSFADVLLFLLMCVGLFLMFVILLQRGRGGGLAGAFGGLGGQSAFGTKAGDVFTVITVVTVVIWVVLACVTGWRIRVESSAEAFFPPAARGIDREKNEGDDDETDRPGQKRDNGEAPAGGGESLKKGDKKAGGTKDGNADGDSKTEAGPSLPEDGSETKGEPEKSKSGREAKPDGGKSKPAAPPDEK